MSWKHVSLIGLGLATVIAGGFLPAAAAATAVIALGSSVVTGALGHAQGDRKNQREPK